MIIHSAHLTLAEFVTMLAEEPSQVFANCQRHRLFELEQSFVQDIVKLRIVYAYRKGNIFAASLYRQCDAGNFPCRAAVHNNWVVRSVPATASTLPSASMVSPVFILGT